jgi:hypothetical protein
LRWNVGSIESLSDLRLCKVEALPSTIVDKEIEGFVLGGCLQLSDKLAIALSELESFFKSGHGLYLVVDSEVINGSENRLGSPDGLIVQPRISDLL